MAEVAATAVLGRQGHAQQALVTGLQPQGAVRRAVALVRQVITLHKAPHGGAKQLVIFAVERALCIHTKTFARHKIARTKR
ncbi:hypothetical protein D3C77_201310 [compost metagenome]